MSWIAWHYECSLVAAGRMIPRAKCSLVAVGRGSLHWGNRHKTGTRIGRTQPDDADSAPRSREEESTAPRNSTRRGYLRPPLRSGTMGIVADGEIAIRQWRPGVDHADASLVAVIALAKRYRQTLGFLPDTAFKDAAEAGHLILAVDGEVLVGYTLYRVTRSVIKLTHV